MILSLNWLKEYTSVNGLPDSIAALIGARLVEIEKTISLEEKYGTVVVAHVVSCEDMENSDHLHVCKLDDAGAVKDVERDENGYVQVVCGAPNVQTGMLVAWLPPRSTVPQTHGTDDPFVLDARKLRGVMSNGMIASARELDLFDEHEGILELDDTAVPGASFASVYGMNDILLDIENKSLTHRPDCFGVIGFARELAAIQDIAFVSPEWLSCSTAADQQPTGLSVTIDDPALSARYQAAVLNIERPEAKTPLRLQLQLAKVGMRPISPIVDVTNYLMMLTGQPLHAFDYDKLAALNDGKIEIHVRAGRTGESLELLDGRTIELTTEDIVIANGSVPVALAGAMGGAATEVDRATTKIVLESATFNLYNLRATQMRHGIFSEAITRFTKGQPAELTAPVLAKAIELLGEITGVRGEGGIAEAYPVPRQYRPVRVRAEHINAVLGTSIDIGAMVTRLRNAEFDVSIDGDELVVGVPFWRTDVSSGEEIIEEIGRLGGYDSIPPTLATREFVAVRPDNAEQLSQSVRRILARAGANEVLTYSFVHGDMLRRAEQKPENSYRLVNSISPDLQYYRQTLTPNLLALVRPNSKAGYDDFALFEINKVHHKIRGLDSAEPVPAEMPMIACVLVKKESLTAAYYDAKALLAYLMDTLGVECEYAALDGNDDGDDPLLAPYGPKRSALVRDRRTGTALGIVGEYKRSVARAFKLSMPVAGFEIYANGLLQAATGTPRCYAPLSKYPGTDRDLCFAVSADQPYAGIVQPIRRVLDACDFLTQLVPVDIYQGNDTATKHVTVRVSVTAQDHTITNQEVDELVGRVVTAVVEATGARLV